MNIYLNQSASKYNTYKKQNRESSKGINNELLNSTQQHNSNWPIFPFMGLSQNTIKRIVFQRRLDPCPNGFREEQSADQLYLYTPIMEPPITKPPLLNFFMVDKEVYRSGCPGFSNAGDKDNLFDRDKMEEGLRYMKKCGITKIIYLREAQDGSKKLIFDTEQSIANRLGIKFVHIPFLHSNFNEDIANRIYKEVNNLDNDFKPIPEDQKSVIVYTVGQGEREQAWLLHYAEFIKILKQAFLIFIAK